MAKKKKTSKKAKAKAPKFQPLTLPKIGDASANIFSMVPSDGYSTNTGSGDIILQLNAVVAVAASGLARQIDIVLTSRGNGGVVSSNQCGLYLQPGVSTPVTLRAIHHNPQPGTYNMKAIIFASSQNPPLLAELPITGAPDWTYTVR